jgi:uncharacterized protein YqgV (UPF0045/DUF77 family)
MSTTVVVEFTIEPFVEGEPGRHVTVAISAVEALGITVDVGPFGSSFVVARDRVGEAVKVLLDAAYGNGATHVNVHAEPRS